MLASSSLECINPAGKTALWQAMFPEVAQTFPVVYSNDPLSMPLLCSSVGPGKPGRGHDVDMSDLPCPGQRAGEPTGSGPASQRGGRSLQATHAQKIAGECNPGIG
jgi:hypothetical protein